MKALADMTNEELLENYKKLEFELNRSLKIEKKLIEKIAIKEHELTLLTVQFEDVSRGFEALRDKYKDEETQGN